PSSAAADEHLRLGGFRCQEQNQQTGQGAKNQTVLHHPPPLVANRNAVATAATNQVGDRQAIFSPLPSTGEEIGRRSPLARQTACRERLTRALCRPLR